MKNQKIIESLWDLHDKYENSEHEICGDAAELITAYNKTGLTPEEIEEKFQKYEDTVLALRTGLGLKQDKVIDLNKERDTLKKALELICAHQSIQQWNLNTAQEIYDYFIQQAQEQEEK